MYMIKDVLNVPKISITNFRQKSKLLSFAFARQNTFQDLWYNFFKSLTLTKVAFIQYSNIISFKYYYSIIIL